MNNFIKVLRDIKNGKMPLVKDWDLQDVIDLNMFVYKLNHGYMFDIQKPKTFTEKIQWYKFFYQSDKTDFSQVTDKVLFKKYIQQRIGDGYVIPMYGAWDNVSDLEKEWNRADSLIPETVVLKANLQSDGRNIKVVREKSKTDFNTIKLELKGWLDPKSTLMNSCDWHFYDSKPMILAEEYMANFENQLYDYKFFCFDGNPFCIYVAQDHFGKDGSHISFYDLNWAKLQVQYGKHIVGNAPKPKHFDQMVEISKVLSKNYPFMRVDFFDTDDQLFIAEMTFNPGGGMTPYHPESFNLQMGELFKLPL